MSHHVRIRESWVLRCRVALGFSSVILTAGVSTALAAPTLPTPRELKIAPREFVLDGSEAVQRLVVTNRASEADAPTVDYSRAATYSSSDSHVAAVDTTGLVRPLGDGSATIRASFAGRSIEAKVQVQGFADSRPISFRNQVVPLFSRYGCNSGGCHGKATGQNGFRLSLLGFDAEFDHAAVVLQGRGRRVFPASPDRSLLLLKAAGGVPHGGGLRLDESSSDYRLMRRWIEQGAPKGSAADPSLVRIEVYPQSNILDRHTAHQMLVTAYYSDGRTRDVTHEAQFKSNETHIANVDDEGLVTTDDGTGDTAVMARYLGHVDVYRITVPLVGSKPAWPTLAERNYVDHMVQSKWRQLKLVPSPLADDATFLRRVFLDTIGTLPTADEVRAFLADKDPEKRSQAIDKLLARNEYADYWAVKWGGILRNKRRNGREAQRGTYAFHAWIRNAFATNMPYDQFVRAIVAAQGTVDQHPPVIWYREVRNLIHQTNDTAQLFLGTRINCAQCHHHPYEKWSQDDYYHFQAFFARLGRKSGESAAEPAIFNRTDGVVRNPASGQEMDPRGLNGPKLDISEDEDPRQKLVDWMVQPDNPFFARAITNRLWAHFMSRGLVEPQDDMRVTNPPSNPELLDALSRDLVEHKYDLKHLIRTILNSTAYQLSSEPNPQNIHDEQNYARAYPRRLIAEVALDAVSTFTGSEESFGGLPKGTRAIQLPDESVGSYFLDVFGRPVRDTPCECERPREANLAQALHMLNSADIQTKVAAGQGRIATLFAAKKTDDQMLDELYLAAFARLPRASEKQTVLGFVGSKKDRKAAWEDVAWAMVNTKEFLFNH